MTTEELVCTNVWQTKEKSK